MVKVVKFRIKNYKSIKDSGDCFLADGITIFAGKNESGKTSILEALEDFGTDKKIRPDATPINTRDDVTPEIIITFEIEKEKLKSMTKALVYTADSTYVILSKNFENKYRIINSQELFSKTFEENEARVEFFESEFSRLNKVLENHNSLATLQKPNNNNISQVKTEFSKIITTVDTIKETLLKEEKAIVEEELEILGKIINKYVNTETFETEFLEEFKNYIPNFILFDTYNDQIPNNIPIQQLKDNSFIRDLASISDLDIELIQNPTKVRENLKHRTKVNVEISEEYKKFWQQDASNLFIDWNNDRLYFWIKEDDEYYEPKQRSKGRQWHLAFYVRVTARSKDGVENIILVDEPGLFLHARAQKDILSKLEDCSKEMAIIFSTHSPYLLDPNKLNRVKLVEKSSASGTKIVKIHAKADKETLTPILTAIGEDLSQGIRVDKKNSFIVEGISDYYYIHAFMKLNGIEKEINIIPGCGDNIPAIASILFGWGLDPYFVIDSNKTRLVNTLKTKLNIDEDVIITLSDETGGNIEGIFSQDDFKKNVLEDEMADISRGVLNYIKTHTINKELLARRFFENVNSGKIKKETLLENSNKNIQHLCDKILNLTKN